MNLSDCVVTIDSGTTNTRVTVWRDRAVVATATRQVGVRDTAITGDKTSLLRGVRETLGEALAHAGLTPADLGLVLASGMITSNLGLHEVAHLHTPVSMGMLAAGLVQADLPEVCPVPIWFVPGVRNHVDNIGLHNCEAMDMMRGEETETAGLMASLNVQGPAIVVLPGSHSKFVHLDAQGRIAGSVTTMAGELLQVITEETILADSLDRGFATDVDAEMLLAGARAGSRIGLGRACFTVRALHQFTIYDRNARASFLLGAVLGADLLTVKNSSAIRVSPGTPFFVTGKPLLRHALGLLIEADDFFTGSVTVLNDEQQRNLSGLGAMDLARQRGLMPAA